MNLEEEKMNLAPKPLPPRLPETATEFLAHRKMKATRSLKDQVEDVHIALYDDKSYKALLEAVYNEQAVEGSLAADDFKAAELIREKAKQMNYVELAVQKLATIAKTLGVVLRRYGASRKERRNEAVRLSPATPGTS
jgi:hypothetical protein